MNALEKLPRAMLKLARCAGALGDSLIGRSLALLRQERLLMTQQELWSAPARSWSRCAAKGQTRWLRCLRSAPASRRMSHWGMLQRPSSEQTRRAAWRKPSAAHFGRPLGRLFFFLSAAPKLALVKSKLLGSKEGTDAMALLREIGATWGETALLLGLAKDATKDTAKARAALEQAKLKQNRWLEAFALLTLTLALQPKGSPGATAVDEFLALAKRHGIHVGEADAASSIRRLQGSGSTTQDLQDIHDRLSAAAKFGQRQGQAWATLDMADAKLQQGLLQAARMRPRKLIRSRRYETAAGSPVCAFRAQMPNSQRLPKEGVAAAKVEAKQCDILHKS
ncbi:unnamed protein product [Effrenium voratum]|nr:unnamed protein product [Effrenium voratum]